MTDHVTPEVLHEWREQAARGEWGASTSPACRLLTERDSLAAQVETISKQLAVEFALARDNLERAVAAETQVEQMRAVVERIASAQVDPIGYAVSQEILAALDAERNG